MNAHRLTGEALIAKLRAYVTPNGDWAQGLCPDDVSAAADEIERLLDAREQAKRWADMPPHCPTCDCDDRPSAR